MTSDKEKRKRAIEKTVRRERKTSTTARVATGVQTLHDVWNDQI